MHTTTAAPNVLRGATLASLVLLVLAFIGACGATASEDVPRSYACGTPDRPPIAIDAEQCRRSAPGAVWYSGRTDDLDEPDEAIVIGQPLDEDWYDPIAQADLDDVHPGSGHSPRVNTAPRAPASPTRVRPTAPIPPAATAAPTRKPTPTTTPTTPRKRNG
jgi:hypothetical protein